MKRLVEAFLRAGDVVIELAGQRTPELMHDAQDAITIGNAVNHHSEREEVIYLTEVSAASRHLPRNTVDVLGSAAHVGLHPMLLELRLEYLGNLSDVPLTGLASRGKLCRDL